MAFDITKPEQAGLTPEEKTWFDGQLKTASESAVTTFKTQAEEERKRAIPEKYDFQFGDKTLLDPKTDAEATSALAKELGLSKEQAAKLLAHQEKLAGGVVARQQQALAGTTAKWGEDLKADKELGGANLDKTVASTRRVMEAFAAKFPDSTLGKLLNETGYGNHVEWVRFVNWISSGLKEDTLPPAGGGGKPERKSTADVLYGAKAAS